MTGTAGRTRRRAPWWILALLFVVVPLVELFLLIQLGQVVGPWWTILILLADGILGSWLVKREGARAFRALREALASHRMPATELADGALILVGGTLLITPGFISDAVGLFCILPFTRPLARGVLARVITRRLNLVGGWPVPPAAGQRSATGPGPTSWRPPSGTGGAGTDPRQAARRPGHGDVIRGEVVDPD